MKKITPKTIHMADDYPCPACGYVETLCGLTDVESDEFTLDEDKVTCKDCFKEIHPRSKKFSKVHK